MAGTSTDALCCQLPAQARLFDVGETSGPWRLRRGLVRLDRVGRDGPLLVMLAKPDVLTCSEPEALRARLPALRVMAELVDAKPETVCRVLGQLLPRGSAPSDGAARWAWAA